MKDTTWLEGLHTTDTQQSMDTMRNEVVYTLKMGDFLHMPHLNFADLADVDPHLRSLLN